LKIARVLVRFDHVARFIVNANHGIVIERRCDSLSLSVAARGVSAACSRFGFARNTAATFDVFYWLQVTNFDVSLFDPAPNGVNHFDVWDFSIHAQNDFPIY
jgi:hypothetical protein